MSDLRDELDLLKENYSASTVAKGRGIKLQGKVKRDKVSDVVFWVEGSRPDKPYRVQLVEGPTLTCTCPNGFKKSQPTCYHTAAVVQVLREELEDA